MRTGGGSGGIPLSVARLQRLLKFVPIPTDEVNNRALGGEDWQTLFITAGGELWSIRTAAPGWVPYPRVRQGLRRHRGRREQPPEKRLMPPGKRQPPIKS